MLSQSSDPIRPAAVAGTWYPGAAEPLRAAVDGHLAAVEASPAGDIVALIAPHAGLRYSGPVAACAYRAIAGRRYDVVMLVGPSHHYGFEGVAVWPAGAFETPLGRVEVEAGVADRLLASPVVGAHPAAHGPEHALDTCRTRPISAVGLPCSTSDTHLRDTPARSAASAWVRPWSRRMARRAAPMRLGLAASICSGAGTRSAMAAG